MDHAAMIVFWFRLYRGGSLLLPDGWYGRPMDSLHQLSSISWTKDTLAVVLDGAIRLTFQALEGVRFVGGELIIGPAKELRFDPIEDGVVVPGPGVRYAGGVAKIVAETGSEQESYLASN